MVSLTIATIALNPNQEMTDFDYKKYSLENLENWLHDAMSSAEATPQEIYDTIVGVVKESYYYHKDQASRANELLALLNGNGQSYEGVKYYKGVSSAYQEDTILKCDKDDPSPECKNAWNDFWENVDDDVKESIKRDGYDWTPVGPKDGYSFYVSEDGDMWIPDSVVKEDKVVKWQLPVQVDGLTGDCYINFPDDLLETANLKEGDSVRWIDRGDGSFELRKVDKD